ncbi:AtpZ/AtpI family protein [Mucilaginibacter sp. Mucisp86]|uniref:AtpZ/AtpI family protein n=1 Tax=Mucilaginibacter sp. Mucisp86 TaxID=3243060 RepID=UPI0039B43E0B
MRKNNHNKKTTGTGDKTDNQYQTRPEESPGYGYAKYSGLGIQMLVIIGAFAYGGYRIDTAARHRIQWVTCILSLAGVFIAIYLVVVSLKKD